ncbi:hypothetical protein CEV34_3568 [Brucella pseudogrignonensis]|uniref:Uncharacterized protein n=1 Tax=Brucella pseudogrignonensis TaxID=419475 RepID=A0A256G916_9HYPH|nr:hypothetical protein CEV34_3568 [Brucella pseudogrignonensis]
MRSTNQRALPVSRSAFSARLRRQFDSAPSEWKPLSNSAIAGRSCPQN